MHTVHIASRGKMNFVRFFFVGNQSSKNQGINSPRFHGVFLVSRGLYFGRTIRGRETMASEFKQIVTSSSAASGSAEFIVEDMELWTGRLVMTVAGGSPSVTYAVKVKAYQAETSGNAYVKHSGTVTSTTDLLVNNNDGDGAKITAYSILVEWSANTDMVINSGFRKEY